LDIRTRAQVLDQAPVNGGFELGAGLVVHDDLLRPPNIGAPRRSLKA
jgi:hypothetical protein